MHLTAPVDRSITRAPGWWAVAPIVSILLACAGTAAHRVAVAPPPDEPAAEGVSPSALAPAQQPPAQAPDDAPAELATGVPGLPELQLDLAALQAEYDIPLEVNEAVVTYVRLFQSEEVRPRFLRWLARAERYLPRFRAIMRQEGVPEDSVYLAMVESGFAALATSPAQAVGAWQFIAETGSRYGLVQDAWVDERRDPDKAAAAAARFLRDLHRRTGDWHLAWAAYNAGPGRISRAMQAGHTSFWEMARESELLPQETRAYVPKVLAAAIVAKHPEAFGFRKEEIAPERWPEVHVVTIARATALVRVAEAAGVTTEELRDLNPELLAPSTPPRPYPLRIPRRKAAVFAARWPAISAAEAPVRLAAVRVKPGETLWSLSRQLGVTVDQLATWNGIAAPERHNLVAGRILRTSEVRRAAPEPGRRERRRCARINGCPR